MSVLFTETLSSFHLKSDNFFAFNQFADVLMTDNDGNVVAGADVQAVVKAEIISDLVKGEK